MNLHLIDISEVVGPQQMNLLSWQITSHTHRIEPKDLLVLFDFSPPPIRLVIIDRSRDRPWPKLDQPSCLSWETEVGLKVVQPTELAGCRGEGNAIRRPSSCVFTDTGQSGQRRRGQMPAKNKDRRHREGPLWLPPAALGFGVIFLYSPYTFFLAWASSSWFRWSATGRNLVETWMSSNN